MKRVLVIFFSLTLFIAGTALQGCGKKSPPKAHCPCEDIKFELPIETPTP